MKTRLLLVTFFLVLVIAVASAQGASSAESALVGTWLWNGKELFRMYGDGSGLLVDSNTGKETRFTWKVEDSAIVARYPETVTRYAFSLNGDILVMTLPPSKSSVTYELVRKR
jgi:hypothetical protein